MLATPTTSVILIYLIETVDKVWTQSHKRENSMSHWGLKLPCCSWVDVSVGLALHCCQSQLTSWSHSENHLHAKSTVLPVSTTLTVGWRPHPLECDWPFLVSPRRQGGENHTGETTAPHYRGGSECRGHVPSEGLLLWAQQHQQQICQL